MQTGGVLANTLDRGEGAGEDKNFAGWDRAVHGRDELDAILFRHIDVAEQELRLEGIGTEHGAIDRVGGTRVEAMFFKDKAKGIGDDDFVVHDEDATHRGNHSQRVGDALCT